MQRIEDFPAFVRGLPEIEVPIAGVRGWLIQGESQQVAFVEFSATTEVPEHSHEEQWEWVVAGRVQLRVGGKIEEFRTGESFYIPAGVAHGATVHAGYRAMIVFNERDRYALKGG